MTKAWTTKALAWHGKGDIRCDTIPDPQDRRDAIMRQGRLDQGGRETVTMRWPAF
jgi:hypothetical protein